MYHLIIHKLGNDKIRVKCPSQNFSVVKFIGLTNCAKSVGVYNKYIAYNYMKKIKEAMRDIAFSQYGKNWRSYFDENRCMESILSAIKRAR